jgi:hypothetical protein
MAQTIGERCSCPRSGLVQRGGSADAAARILAAEEIAAHIISM